MKLELFSGNTTIPGDP